MFAVRIAVGSGLCEQYTVLASQSCGYFVHLICWNVTVMMILSVPTCVVSARYIVFVLLIELHLFI